MKIIAGKEQEYGQYVERNSQDDYSKAVVTYSERWADEMEALMDMGQSLETVAEPASHTADEEGITGFMYGCAVEGLAHYWVHGEELRRWHNEKYNAGPEVLDNGGVANPAILNVGE